MAFIIKLIVFIVIGIPIISVIFIPAITVIPMILSTIVESVLPKKQKEHSEKVYIFAFLIISLVLGGYFLTKTSKYLYTPKNEGSENLSLPPGIEPTEPNLYWYRGHGR